MSRLICFREVRCRRCGLWWLVGGTDARDFRCPECGWHEPRHMRWADGGFYRDDDAHSVLYRR